MKNYSVERLSGNRLTVTFESANTLFRYRVLLFAVSQTGRGQSLERRVEITSTYAGGNLDPISGFADLVVGIDRQTCNMVGLDARRLNFGGDTHNASTFVYLPAFNRLTSTQHFVLINDRQSILNREYQVYFRPDFASPYLLEAYSLHRSGLRQTPAVPVKESLADAIEEFSSSGSKAKLSYDQQIELALKKMEIGRAGESLVFGLERERLRSAGRTDLADAVNWISQSYPYLGYDIASFSETGVPVMVEVKSSMGTLKSFFLTANEFKQAKKLSDGYKIACVSNVLKNATVCFISSPAKRISDGSLSMCAVTYKVVI